MGFWKVFAGAAIGVGAIAAAPFTGGGSVLGAATLLGSLSGAGALAAGAGIAGAAAGAVLAKEEEKQGEKKYKEAEHKGYQRGKAEHNLEMIQLKEKLAEKMADIAKREQFILTAFALGICCAYADGDVCNTEMDELDYLVTGIGTSEMLSSSTKKQIMTMRMYPPNLSTVWEMIKKHNFDTPQHLSMFSTVVELVVHADEMETPEEREFIERWNNLSAHAA
jgi:hypothetical protein